jgi:3-hydroxyisobutyrate dehydrogenase-like beta-hydroxyacid dehydrogenase
MADVRVGFCGMGTMGAAMAANVARAGFSLTVWNRTPGRAAGPVSAGATEASSLADVARASDVLVIRVSDTRDIEAVLFGPDAIAEGGRAGLLIVDRSTISPTATREFAGRLAASGMRFVDAPESGGSEGARQGTLSIMVGGDAADVERARPVLAAMGRTVTHIGPVGAGRP